MDDLGSACFDLFGRHLSPEEMHAFQVYEDELCAWNEKVNLTAIRERREIRIKHFLDSLTCLSALGDMRGLKLIDIGTGAGFPGLPIKIMEPKVTVVLSDSVGKKLAFCDHLIEKLKLSGISTLQSRAEDLGQSAGHREMYDLATARAVAALVVLAEYLLPLLRVGGKAVIQKGENGPAELEQAERAIRVLGGGIESISPVLLPGVVETRYLIVLTKIRPTPQGYPRRAGVPLKKPLV